MFAQMDRERLFEMKTLLMSYRTVLHRRVPQLEQVSQPLIAEVGVINDKEKGEFY